MSSSTPRSIPVAMTTGTFLVLLLSLLALGPTTYGHTSAEHEKQQQQQQQQRQQQEKAINAWFAGGGNCSCDLGQVRKDLEEERTKRQELRGQMETYVSELHELRALVGSMKNSSDADTDTASPNAVATQRKAAAVSFSAKLSYNRELKPLDTVVFDTATTNNGDSYNTDTGKFTAPVPGTYMFFATILSGYNTKVETALIVNDKEVARMYSGAHDAHGSGSNGAIVNLKAGDSAWVRLLFQGGNHVHGYYSSFMGFLLDQKSP